MSEIDFTVEIMPGTGSVDAEQLHEDLSQLWQDLLEVPGIGLAEVAQAPGPPGTRGVGDVASFGLAVVVSAYYTGRMLRPVVTGKVGKSVARALRFEEVLAAVRAWKENHPGGNLRFTFSNDVHVELSGPWSESDRQEMMARFEEAEVAAHRADPDDDSERVDLRGEEHLAEPEGRGE